MGLSRRQFVARLGGAGLVYVFGCRRDELRPADGPFVGGVDPDPTSPSFFSYDQWLVVGRDGTVTAYTGRTEIGQGLTTVLYDLVCQGLEIPAERLSVVMGDTDVCPDDGPTSGSSATRTVGWGYWLTCARLRADAVELAAERWGCAPEGLVYRDAQVVDPADATRSLALAELGDGRVREVVLDSEQAVRSDKAYVDLGNPNARGEAIVTGTQTYAGDLTPPGCRHGAFLLPPYHANLTRVLAADPSAAEATPDVALVHQGDGWVGVVGATYPAVRRALDRVEVRWRRPGRARELDPEREIRAGAELLETVEERGDLAEGFAASHRVFRETYVTQYASVVPLETDTAVAEVGTDRATIWIGTQNPWLQRRRVAEELGLDESRVRVVAMPAGGAFGSKGGHVVGVEAARLSRLAGGGPVKYVYSREEEFQRRAAYKEVVVVDLATGVSRDGRVLAREVDIYQDWGKGTENVYSVPNVRTRLYRAPMPIKHATMRGTSFTQVCFALESHMDTVAHGLDLDPIELRRRNAGHPMFGKLLDVCAEAIDRDAPRPPDTGVGFAMCWHGGMQLGAVAAEVAVDRGSGTVSVRRLCGAFDVGLVVNRNTLAAGTKGAMIWGLGYALFEEARLDGHSSHAARLSEYRLPRFADVPEIEIAFFDEAEPGRPRGAGEMPLVPTIGAICNAVYDAIGVRFHTLPLTPERVLAALAEA